MLNLSFDLGNQLYVNIVFNVVSGLQCIFHFSVPENQSVFKCGQSVDDLGQRHNMDFQLNPICFFLSSNWFFLLFSLGESFDLVFYYFFVSLKAILLLNSYPLLLILETNNFSVEVSDLIEDLELGSYVSHVIKQSTLCFFVNNVTIKTAHSRAIPPYGTPRMQNSLRINSIGKLFNLSSSLCWVGSL